MELSQPERIKEKLFDLKSRDRQLKVFGAGKHRYELQRPLTENEISAFETTYRTRLPEEYRNFIKHVGNGGAGPYYGVEALEFTVCDDLDRKDLNDRIDPSVDFPHTAAWNLEFEESEKEEDYARRDKVYFDKKWITGVLRICNFGCGVYLNLVVKGQERGNIWVDDRCNDGGIYPDRYFGNKEPIDFLTWYELWLDGELKQLENSPQVNNTPVAGRNWLQKLFGIK